MNDVTHYHETPSPLLLVRALEAANRGDVATANHVIRPWSCCRKGMLTLAVAHYVLGTAIITGYTRQLVAYDVRALVFTDAVSEVDRERWHLAYSAADLFLAGDETDGVATLAEMLERDVAAAPVVLGVGTRLLADALNREPADGAEAIIPATGPADRV